MAKKSRPNKQTDELKVQIARSREYVARDLRGVRYELDVPRKIRRSFRQQTGVWVAVAVVAGTLLVLLPARKKKVYVDLDSGRKGKPEKKLFQAGVVVGLLKFAALARPALTNFVTNKVRGYAERPQNAARWR